MKGTPRPTRLGWLPLVAAPVLGVLSVMTVDSWLLLLAGASLGLGVAAILLRPRLLDLDVFITVPPRAAVGEVVMTHVEVRNHGRRTSPLSTVTHCAVGLSDVEVVVDGLEPGASASLWVQREAVARCRTTTSLVRVVSSAPLGLVATSAAGPVPTPLTVHPMLAAVPLPAGRARDAEGAKARADRAGADIHGVREWRSGDPARAVHWRSTARRGRLVVFERETPDAGAVNILLHGDSTQPGFEHLVSVVASTGLVALSAGSSVLLQVAGPGPTALACSARGDRGQRTQLLDWCAGVAPTRWADRGELEAAVAAAGRRGLLYVAAVAAPYGWWELARAVAAPAGVQVSALPGSGP